MKKILAGVIFLGMSLVAAQAEEWKVGSITISAPFARASAGMANAGGGFMQISNEGEADRLIAASADVGHMTELHTHIKEGDVMRMRAVEAIDVPANGAVALKPGSFHVMFMKLKEPLKEGESFPLELTFEHAGKVTIEMPVAGVGAMNAPKM
ncbi:copper chaperone PCu(A)C [uncultured Cohaesibacter sp.]|uniref:copper chaperone PCu(A)C n=1 Tax=uncultured Cohaesibacter sp. TaxID=1002546 RepID=UPI0029C98E3B|nr:copper chaperone PCu(A)C [uncultured Cohaesibacter sp.]